MTIATGALSNTVASSLWLCDQRVLDLLPLVRQAAMLDRLLDRGTQPPEPVLEQVVGGALPHALGGGLLAHRAADDDHRDRQGHPVHVRNRPERVEARKGKVRKHDVELLVEGGDEVVLAVDVRPLGIEALAAQLGHHQLGIGRPVLEDQGTQRLRHRASIRSTHRRLVEQQPVHAEAAHTLGELLKVDRLGDVRVHTEPVALDHVALLARRGQHHDRDVPRALVAFDPPKHLETVHEG